MLGKTGQIGILTTAEGVPDVSSCGKQSSQSSDFCTGLPRALEVPLLVVHSREIKTYVHVLRQSLGINVHGSNSHNSQKIKTPFR